MPGKRKGKSDKLPGIRLVQQKKGREQRLKQKG